MLGGMHNEKIHFCTNTINEIQDAIRLKLQKEGNTTALNLYAYIVSGTSYQKINKHWNLTRQDFKNNHILFQEINRNYLNELFENKI